MDNKPWPCIDCRVMMIHIDDDHCKCPACGTEVWYNYDTPDLSEDDEAVNHDTEYVSRSLPERYKVPPGGCKSGKRAKKKGTQIYSDDRFEG